MDGPAIWSDGPRNKYDHSSETTPTSSEVSGVMLVLWSVGPHVYPSKVILVKDDLNSISFNGKMY